LEHSPFAAPLAEQPTALGTDELAAAVREGRLLRIADGTYLLPMGRA
jgi:hypothetical protein